VHNNNPVVIFITFLQITVYSLRRTAANNTVEIIVRSLHNNPLWAVLNVRFQM